MKKLILVSAFLLSLGGSIFGQVPCLITSKVTGSGVSSVIDNRVPGCYQWRVNYSSTGFSGLSLQLEEAPDAGGVPGSWSAFSGSAITDGSNPSTNTNAATIGIHSAAAWVRLNITSVTGSGAIYYQVWGANSTSSVAALVNSIATTLPITNTGSASNPNIACPTCAVTNASFTPSINAGTDTICAVGKDSTLFLDGTLKTVTVTPGTDVALPNAGTWTTTGGGGSGASGTFTASSGNLATVTIAANGSGYTSNPTFVPSSGAIGTSTTAFSGCANASNANSETVFATTITLPSGVLADNTVPFKLLFAWKTTATIPSTTLKLRFGGISGTLLFQSTAQNSSGAAAAMGSCEIFSPASSGASEPIVLTCGIQGQSSGTLYANSLVVPGTPYILAATNTPEVLVVTVTFGAATAGNALTLYGIGS